MQRAVLGHAALVVLTLIAFWGAWNLDFVSYDDPQYYSGNPIVSDGLSAQGISWAFQTGHAANWHPFTWISLMWDAQWMGPGPAAPHTGNLLLHIIASLLLFEFLRRATGMKFSAWLVAALFALHPAHVESVAWISERKDVLSAAFGFASLLAYVSYARHPARGRMVWVAIFLGAGLLSKQMLVTWPLLMLLLDRWPLRREESPRELIREKLALFALCVAAGLATLWAQSSGGAVASTESLAPLSRLANAIVVLPRYVSMLAWPHELSFVYPHPYLTPAIGAYPAATIALSAASICVAVFLAWRSKSAPLQNGLAIFILLLLPVIGILQVGPQSMAARYTYLPSIGLFCVFAFGLGTRLPRQLFVGISLAIVVASSVATRAELRHWQNDVTLYGRAIEVTEHNWLAHSNYGKYLSEHGQNIEAEKHYAAALAAKPDHAATHYNLGTLRLLEGRLQEAELSLQKAVQYSPSYAAAWNNLGQVLGRSSRHPEAAQALARAHELDPVQVSFESNYADALRRSGQIEAAWSHLSSVLARAPEHAPSQDIAARLFFSSDLARATEHARLATTASRRLNPIFLETLAQCLLAAGDSAGARETSRVALPLAKSAQQVGRVQRLEAILQ